MQNWRYGHISNLASEQSNAAVVELATQKVPVEPTQISHTAEDTNYGSILIKNYKVTLLQH